MTKHIFCIFLSIIKQFIAFKLKSEKTYPSNWLLHFFACLMVKLTFHKRSLVALAFDSANDMTFGMIKQMYAHAYSVVTSLVWFVCCIKLKEREFKVNKCGTIGRFKTKAFCSPTVEFFIRNFRRLSEYIKKTETSVKNNWQFQIINW